MRDNSLSKKSILFTPSVNCFPRNLIAVQNVRYPIELLKFVSQNPWRYDVKDMDMLDDIAIWL